MSSFAFTDSPVSVTLEEAPGGTGRSGTLTVTARNTTARRMAGRLVVRPDGAAQPGWFAIEGAAPTNPGELWVEFEPQATRTLRVLVRPPADAPAGRHVFRLGLAAERDLQDDYVESPAVAFEVPPRDAPPPPPPSPGLPWWVIAAAVALVAVLGGAGLWWMLREEDAPARAMKAVPAVRGELVVAATAKLVEEGFAIQVAGVTRQRDLPDNAVSELDPQAGSIQPAGTLVRIKVNARPENPNPNFCNRFPRFCEPIRGVDEYIASIQAGGEGGSNITQLNREALPALEMMVHRRSLELQRPNR